jgi:hypothetical protein
VLARLTDQTCFSAARRLYLHDGAGVFLLPCWAGGDHVLSALAFVVFKECPYDVLISEERENRVYVCSCAPRCSRLFILTSCAVCLSVYALLAPLSKSHK